jgi:hypothetical protein
MNKKKFVLAAGLSVALTPAVAAADSLPLVALHLVLLIGVIAHGVTIHKQMKKGTAQ